MNKKKTGLVAALALLFLLVAGGCVWYVNDYYHGDDTVAQYLMNTDEVTVREVETGLLFDGSGESQALIFYPGAKVEYTAYSPLLYKVAEAGIDCFLVKMPLNLAIFGVNKAEDILQSYDYDNWYLAGHSLGGAMAASFVSGHPDEFQGLVLLAAYPTQNLPAQNFHVLTVYGSEDKVLNRGKLEAGKQFMPQEHTGICIEGGNHAWFGNYGQQDKDGTATVTHEEQQDQTVDAILNMIMGIESVR